MDISDDYNFDAKELKKILKIFEFWKFIFIFKTTEMGPNLVLSSE